jgi:adenylylsulfate reductase subunit B
LECGHTSIRSPKDCWGCAACLKECRYGAITYFLGADIGGSGASMRVNDEGDFLEWILEKPQKIERIVVARKESNAY